jgi:hypothetical protein
MLFYDVTNFFDLKTGVGPHATLKIYRIERPSTIKGANTFCILIFRKKKKYSTWWVACTTKGDRDRLDSRDVVLGGVPTSLPLLL